MRPQHQGRNLTGLVDRQDFRSQCAGHFHVALSRLQCFVAPDSKSLGVGRKPFRPGRNDPVCRVGSHGNPGIDVRAIGHAE